MAMKQTPAPSTVFEQLREASMTVVPDVLRATFSASVDDSGRSGLAALERAGSALSTAVTATLPAAKVVFEGFHLKQVASKLKSRGDESVQPTILGHIDVPLALELSFWGRARLVTALHAITDAASAEAARAKPKIRVVFHQPVAIVADPDRLRKQLIQRWFEQVAQLHAQATSAGICQAVRLQSCSLPGPVQQRPRNLMEVTLELDLRPAGPLQVVHADD